MLKLKMLLHCCSICFSEAFGFFHFIIFTILSPSPSLSLYIHIYGHICIGYIYKCICPVATFQVCGFFGMKKASASRIITVIMQTFPASVITVGLISMNSYCCAAAETSTNISWIKEFVLNFVHVHVCMSTPEAVIKAPVREGRLKMGTSRDILSHLKIDY